MNSGTLDYALKMIKEEFKLGDPQVQKLARRMQADDVEFARVWELYKNVGGKRYDGHIDRFRDVLRELLD